MKSILFVLSIFALAILYNNATKETAKYKNLYIEKINEELTATERCLIDMLDSHQNDSLVYRLRELNSILNDE